jgi:hypothetical protein
MALHTLRTYIARFSLPPPPCPSALAPPGLIPLLLSGFHVGTLPSTSSMVRSAPSEEMPVDICGGAGSDMLLAAPSGTTTNGWLSEPSLLSVSSLRSVSRVSAVVLDRISWERAQKKLGRANRACDSLSTLSREARRADTRFRDSRERKRS